MLYIITRGIQHHRAAERRRPKFRENGRAASTSDVKYRANATISRASNNKRQQAAWHADGNLAGQALSKVNVAPLRRNMHAFSFPETPPRDGEWRRRLNDRAALSGA